MKACLFEEWSQCCCWNTSSFLSICNMCKIILLYLLNVSTIILTILVMSLISVLYISLTLQTKTLLGRVMCWNEFIVVFIITCCEYVLYSLCVFLNSRPLSCLLQLENHGICWLLTSSYYVKVIYVISNLIIVVKNITVYELFVVKCMWCNE